MNKWKVLYNSIVEKDLRHVSPDFANAVMRHIENILAADPLNKSKPLLGKWRKYWSHKYRKDWRIIFLPNFKEESFTVLYIQHRSPVYKGKPSK